MRVAVLGVGLIGGSIGLAARKRVGAHVCGFDPDPDVLARALEAGAIDSGASSLAEAVVGAEFVFVAAPVGVLLDTVRAALDAADANCVVSDVGSTKRTLAELAGDERFVGGHPLAGAETSGVEHAREDLFEGATWYLTPGARSSGVLYERLHRLLSSLGACPNAIDVETHDRLMARISHLPHVLANLLVIQAAGMLGEGDARRLPAVGPSFRDATRVAGASSAIWTDIYLANADALVSGIDELTAGLEDIRARLADGQAPAIAAWNERARADRDALFGSGLIGGADGETPLELRVSVPNRPGVIAEIALTLGEAGVNILDLALSPSPDNSQGVVALWVHGEMSATRAQELISGLGFPVVQA